jgi:hypothetical protein
LAVIAPIFPSYTIKPIAKEGVDRAFPLMRAVAPDLSLQEWRQYCRDGGAKEETVVAINSTGYVKGLCIFSVRDHMGYGRLLDVPLFVVASAADADGVGGELLRFLEATRDGEACSGVRFWTMGADTWDRRLSPEDIRRTDHGVYLPATAGAHQAENALAACMRASPTLIDRPSR